MLQAPVVPIPESDKYMNEYDFTVTFEDKDITVPTGFIYDGASIPKIGLVWMITYTNFHPKVMTPALIHDYLYTTGSHGKDFADRFFRTLLLKNGVPKIKAGMMYKAVKHFGKGNF